MCCRRSGAGNPPTDTPGSAGICTGRTGTLLEEGQEDEGQVCGEGEACGGVKKSLVALKSIDPFYLSSLRDQIFVFLYLIEFFHLLDI